MRTTRIMAIAALVATAGLAVHVVQAQQVGSRRIDLQRHDLSVTGREVIQTIVELAPGTTAPKHTHPGEEIIYVLEGTWEYTVEGKPPVILKALEGLSGTRPVLINVGRSFKLTPSQLYWKILFPSALPSIFVGVRLGMIFALINIVGVEFLINFGGLGQLVNELSERYDLPGTYAAISFVVLVSVLFFIGTERIEKWLRPGT